MQFIDNTGKKFGRLTVIGFSHFNQESPRVKRSIWNCKCDCGTMVEICGKRMRNGTTLSCGCLRRETTTKKNFIHGSAKRGKLSPEYNTWCEMIRRTENKNCEGFKNYGHRGISMCHEWRRSFPVFFKDMGPKPSPKHSIERKDNNKGYSKANCKWAVRHEQARNKRNNRNFVHEKTSYCLTDLAEKIGIKKTTFYSRLKRGWSLEKAINTPVRKQ